MSYFESFLSLFFLNCLFYLNYESFLRIGPLLHPSAAFMWLSEGFSKASERLTMRDGVFLSFELIHHEAID